MVNCCGLTKRGNVQFLAITDMALSFISLSFTCSHLLSILLYRTDFVLNLELEEFHQEMELSKNSHLRNYGNDNILKVALLVAITTLCIEAFLCLIQIILGGVLFSGATQRESGKCRIWFTISIVVFAFGFVNLIVNVGLTPVNFVGSGTTIFHLAFKTLILWRVYSFINYLKYDEKVAGDEDEPQSLD